MFATDHTSLTTSRQTRLYNINYQYLFSNLSFLLLPRKYEYSHVLSSTSPPTDTPTTDNYRLPLYKLHRTVVKTDY